MPTTSKPIQVLPWEELAQAFVIVADVVKGMDPLKQTPVIDDYLLRIEATRNATAEVAQ